METIEKDLEAKRNKLIVDAGEILTLAAKDGREGLRADEQEKWERLHDDATAINTHLEIRRQQAEFETHLNGSAGRQADPNPVATETRGSASAEYAQTRLRHSHQDAELALRSWLLSGSPEGATLPPSWLEASTRCGVNPLNKNLTIRLSPRPLKDEREVSAWEQRAQTLTTTGGGYLVPDEMMRAIEIALLRFGGMRTRATVIRTSSGADMPIPMNDDTSNKGSILAINVATTELAFTFTQLVLNSFKYTSRLILIPVELMQDSSINLPEFVGNRLGERIGRITNDHFTTGNGTTEPNGIVTAAFLGKTGTTGQTTTYIYADLVDLEHSVDPEYRGNAAWMMPDATLKALKKLVDGQSRPLWQPGLSGLAQAAPDTLLGYPYIINQSMAVPAASAKTLLFGDFSKYLIRDVADITLLRLDERYAEFHQVAFLAFSRHDADLMDAGTHPVKYYVHPSA